MEKTLVIIKPDDVKNKRLGEIISLFEQDNFRIIGIKMIKLTKDEAENLYFIHRGKAIYNNLVRCVTSGSSVFLAIEGSDIIDRIKKIINQSYHKKSVGGNINPELDDNISENALHSSENGEMAKFEVNFFFPEFAWE